MSSGGKMACRCNSPLSSSLRDKNDRLVFNWLSKVISRLLLFCLTALCDWLTNLAPVSQPMNNIYSSKILLRIANFEIAYQKFQNQSCLARTRFQCAWLRSYVFFDFEFWLVHCVVRVCCDWPEWLLLLVLPHANENYSNNAFLILD